MIFFFRGIWRNRRISYREDWHLRIAARLLPREDIRDVIADLALSDVVGAGMATSSSSSSSLGASCKRAYADLTRSRLAIDGGNEEDFSSSAALTLFLSCLEPLC